MNLHLEDPYIREHLLDGEFGLEKELLRVTAEVLQFEYGKLADIKNSYAYRVKEEFGDAFAEKALVLAKENC